ncbi:MAG TPA: hypothetical protein VFB58_10690 [Chloroflexota bacterium]|nr:hypothetical protein [Chloroflexota bacterium]
MTHLDDGTLRRAHDEPLILDAAARAHLTACPACRERAEHIAGDADATGVLFATPVPPFDVAAARARVQVRPARLRFLPRRIGLPLGAAAAVAALAVAATVTPAGSLAQSFIDIFQPKQVAVLPVTAQELRSLPHLNQYGVVHPARNVQPQQVGSAAAAGQATGMTVLTPSSLPTGIPSTAQYDVIPSSTSSFTFSAARARRTAARRHLTLPAMPSNLNGSTLSVRTGAGVVTMYGQLQDMSGLAIGQMQAPTISSTGASVREMENYVLALPGVSPQLASAIRSIGDPTSVLPIPIPANLVQTQPVTVQGVSGTEISDNTGMAGAVIWEKDGIIYGVGGTVPFSQVLTVANCLR